MKYISFVKVFLHFFLIKNNAPKTRDRLFVLSLKD